MLIATADGSKTGKDLLQIGVLQLILPKFQFSAEANYGHHYEAFTLPIYVANLEISE